MAGKSDPLILALGRLTRELKNTIESIPTESGKRMAIQLGRDILAGIEKELEIIPQPQKRHDLGCGTQVEA